MSGCVWAVDDDRLLVFAVNPLDCCAPDHPSGGFGVEGASPAATYRYVSNPKVLPSIINGPRAAANRLRGVRRSGFHVPIAISVASDRGEPANGVGVAKPEAATTREIAVSRNAIENGAASGRDRGFDG